MPLVILQDILPSARAAHVAVPAFNIANHESLRAVVDGAIEENLPVIVQVYQRLLQGDKAAQLAVLARSMAAQAPVPIVLHADHVESIELIKKALDAGFTSVMMDGSKHPFEENLKLTLQARALAKRYGASLEAEIGHVQFGAVSVDASCLTRPDEAARFFQASGVDALAVSIGTTHGFYREPPKLDFVRLEAIASAVPVPLVLHGGSGTPDAELMRAIGGGIAKINIATELHQLFADQTRGRLAKNEDRFQPIDLLMEPVYQAMKKYARVRLRTFCRTLKD
ncbi:MAG: class II fructose-bisphosphate aldolase [Verrucomicrobiae bacterium]|nr:class II fructose-bisphosphate aldolase [Verrucomicrobiae bacterium]